MPKYKAGKQIGQLSFAEIQEKVARAKNKLTVEALAFFWLLYYSGVRKSELYERIVDDCQLTQTHLIIDFQQRKKGSAKTDPLEIPLWFPGMDMVSEQLKRARKRRKLKKLIEKTRKGERSTKRVKAKWLFPHIHKTWALYIVKTVLGSKYYPHFLRLNRITELCSDPEANLTRIKSFSGIKSTRIIEENYMGTSKKEQRAAVNFMAKQIKKKNEKGS